MIEVHKSIPLEPATYEPNSPLVLNEPFPDKEIYPGVEICNTQILSSVIYPIDEYAIANDQHASESDEAPYSTDAHPIYVVAGELLVDAIKRNPRTAVGIKMNGVVLDVLQNDARSRIMGESSPADSAELTAELSDSLSGLDVAEKLIDLKKRIK